MSQIVNYIMQNYGMPVDSEIDSKSLEKAKRKHKKKNHKNHIGGQSHYVSNFTKSGGAILSESSDSDSFADPKDIKNRPNGGFPNIILCTPDSDSESSVDKEKVSRREVSTDKAILSISQILKSRRNF